MASGKEVEAPISGEEILCPADSFWPSRPPDPAGDPGLALAGLYHVRRACPTRHRRRGSEQSRPLQPRLRPLGGGGRGLNRAPGLLRDKEPARPQDSPL